MISIVVPIFNEQENLPELHRRVAAALVPTGEAWELVLVDDGSRDTSALLIRGMHATDPRVKLVSLSRNFGHQPAVTAGLRHAGGDCVVLMDGDLQDPPELIPAMVARWREGFQVVTAERTGRADARGLRGLGFKLFYPIMRAVTDLPVVPSAGIFGLMDRAVVDQLNALPEHHRFVPGLRAWLGFTRGTVTYDRADRAAGQPKQTLGRLVGYAADAMFSFSTKPLRAATWFGFAASLASFVLAVWYVATFFAFDKPITGFTTTIVCVLFLGGVQLIAVGILGEYVGRIYDEVKQRPLYVVKERVGFGADARPEPADARSRKMTAEAE